MSRWAPRKIKVLTCLTRQRKKLPGERQVHERKKKFNRSIDRHESLWMGASGFQAWECDLVLDLAQG